MKKITPLIFETYLAIINNSLKSKSFSNFYAKVNGKKVDVLRNGDLSCAFFLSSVLILFKFISKVHTTIKSTLEDLEKSGWKKISKPKIGSVLVWEKIKFPNGESNRHIGFYIGNNKAVSTNHKLGYPVKHHWKFNGKRKIENILWNSAIVEK